MKFAGQAFENSSDFCKSIINVKFFTALIIKFQKNQGKKFFTLSGVPLKCEFQKNIFEKM
jgi:hypothetical protein